LEIDFIRKEERENAERGVCECCAQAHHAFDSAVRNEPRERMKKHDSQTSEPYRVRIDFCAVLDS
jgi:hypothetical protein